MAKIKLNNQRIIGNTQTPYFIAEVNSSHNGNIEVAKEMCLKAKEAGLSLNAFVRTAIEEKLNIKRITIEKAS